MWKRKGGRRCKVRWSWANDGLDADRTTPIGKMIDSYLKGETEVEDHVIHLLFSANRWEAV